jgi:hypothetical protein
MEYMRIMHMAGVEARQVMDEWSRDERAKSRRTGAR